MKPQAKFLGPVHETYQICEQRMFWRGFTLAQSPETARAFADALKRRDEDEGSGQILKASSRMFGANGKCKQRIPKKIRDVDVGSG